MGASCKITPCGDVGSCVLFRASLLLFHCLHFHSASTDDHPHWLGLMLAQILQVMGDKTSDVTVW